MFKAGSTIRDLETGEIFMVIQSFKHAILVGRLDNHQKLNSGLYIYERDWDQFAPDTKCERVQLDAEHYQYKAIAV